MKIYHNPRCSKSRQTLQLLEEHNVKVEIVEYLNDVPSADELKALLKKLNLSPVQLIRKSESIYKEKFKGKELTDAQWIDAMIQHPKLIERPIVVKGNKAVLGRPPENVLDLI